HQECDREPEGAFVRVLLGLHPRRRRARPQVARVERVVTGEKGVHGDERVSRDEKRRRSGLAHRLRGLTAFRQAARRSKEQRRRDEGPTPEGDALRRRKHDDPPESAPYGSQAPSDDRVREGEDPEEDRDEPERDHDGKDRYASELRSRTERASPG